MPRARDGKQKPASPRKPGRPLLAIDKKVVEGMAAVGATNIEIAEFVGCSVDTLTRHFAEFLAKTRTDLRTRLRRAQLTAAFDGNATMLIWLGKQMLGQQDKQALEHSGPDGGPIQVQAEELRERLTTRLAGLATRLTPQSFVPVAGFTDQPILANGKANGNGRHG
jgi:AraC-like DNA-binding protein